MSFKDTYQLVYSLCLFQEPIIANDSILNKTFPLKHPWGFYFLSNEKGVDWMDRLSHICQLSSVEEFWA